jgi:hypothetical protein
MPEPKDTRTWEQKGYDSYPERHNYPDAATQAESDWLAGWYRKMREEQLEQVAPELDADAHFGRDSFAVGYTRD